MKKISPLHIVLFVLTLLSTLLAGMFQKGINPLHEPSRFHEGLPFALTLIVILLSHELSHYFTSRKHRTAATLPYFIPAPTYIGTFGAFIKMKSPITTRTALIDIGASGPIAGFIVSFFATVIGLYLSDVVLTAHEHVGLVLGDSLLFSLMTRIIFGALPEGYDILLNPVAFAGWIGFFVTSLNLIPVGQLDGGHILYAVLGEKHKMISRVLIFFLIIMGIAYWPGWVVWAVLLIILGISHPPVLYWESPLHSSRRKIGYISLIIFVLTFTPTPFTIV